MNGCMHTCSSASSLSMLLLFRASNQEMLLHTFILYLPTSIKGIKTILTDIPATQPVYTDLYWEICPQPNPSTQSFIETFHRHTHSPTRLYNPSLRNTPRTQPVYRIPHWDFFSSWFLIVLIWQLKLMITGSLNVLQKNTDNSLLKYQSYLLPNKKTPKFVMTPAQKFQKSQSHHEQKEHNRVDYRFTRCHFPSPQSQVKPPPKAEALLYCGYTFSPSYGCRRSSLSHLVPVTMTPGL